ncbi:unnamed protein product, partial [Dovyalis caffra]
MEVGRCRHFEGDENLERGYQFIVVMWFWVRIDVLGCSSDSVEGEEMRLSIQMEWVYVMEVINKVVDMIEIEAIGDGESEEVVRKVL